LLIDIFLDEYKLSLYIRIKDMKTMSVGEFKTHFSEVLEQVKAGEEIAVTYGKKKKWLAIFSQKNHKRQNVN